MQTNKDLRFKFHLTGEIQIPGGIEFTYLDLMDNVTNMIKSSDNIMQNIVLSDVDNKELIKNDIELELFLINEMTDNQLREQLRNQNTV